MLAKGLHGLVREQARSYTGRYEDAFPGTGAAWGDGGSSLYAGSTETAGASLLAKPLDGPGSRASSLLRRALSGCVSGRRVPYGIYEGQAAEQRSTRNRRSELAREGLARPGSRASSRLRRTLSGCVSRRWVQPEVYGGSSLYASSTETVGKSLFAKRSHGLVREQARAYDRWPGTEIEPDLHKAASLSGIEGSAYMAPGMAPEGGKSGRTAARPGCPGALSLWLLSLCAGRRSAGKEKVTRPGGRTPRCQRNR